MSVYIQDMKAPRGCDECFFEQQGCCALLGKDVYGWGRRLDCPIIEFPENTYIIMPNSMRPSIEQMAANRFMRREEET